VIGADGDDDNGDYSGSVYVYEQPVDDCNENGICDFDEIEKSPFLDVNDNGILDECEPGACCIGTEVVCTESTESYCLQFGGQWAGVGTTCQAVSCPDSCVGDLIDGGGVSVADLMLLLENWGPCP
jgi:hypothetical protein